MSETQNTTDALARLDGALSRIDSVIDTVTRKLDRSRQEQENLALERDIAIAELEELRGRHAVLQAKADHAAERIDALIAVVERALLDGADPEQPSSPGETEPGYAAQPAAIEQPAAQPVVQAVAPSAPQPAPQMPAAAPVGFAPHGAFRPGY